MNRIKRRSNMLSILIVLFLLCAAIFGYDYYKGAKTWVIHPSNKDIYNNGELTVGGTIYSSDGQVLLTSDENGLHYAEGKNTRLSTLHVIGDKNNNITSGVLYTQKTKLIGYDILNGVYNSKSKVSTINLTINANLSRIGYELLGNNNGAISIYNYKTGEVLCMVSKISYDPEDVPDLSDEYYEGVYVNRVTNGLYTPGSIMKIVTAYAGIENIDDIYYQKFTCNGSTTIAGEVVNCSGHHGEQDFSTAFANSCNVAFGQIAVQLGDETMQAYANKAGLTSSYSFDGVTTSKGIVNITDAETINLAWAGIGQYTTLVNPMQYMLFMGTIANEGTIKLPHYITDSSFISDTINNLSSDERLVSVDTASKLQQLMRNATIVNYGDDNFPGLNLCAKTGTAQIDNKSPNSLFVGYCDNDDIPLAFCCVVENTDDSLRAKSLMKSMLAEARKLYE